MANDLTKNPWIIDTAATTVLSTDKLRIAGLRWVGATTAGHQAIIQDKNGRVVWSGVAIGSNNEEADRPGLGTRGIDADGLIVPTLTSGTLYLELA